MVRVNRMRLYCNSPPGGDFIFELTAPDGTAIATGSLVHGWTGWLPVPASITDGRGIWIVEINRATGSPVSAPALLPPAGAGNAVSESYVSPYGDPAEGILGAEVDWVATPPPETCPALTLKAKVSDECVGGKREVTLTPTAVAPGASRPSVQIDFGDGTKSSPFAVIAGSPIMALTHFYLPRHYIAKLEVIPPPDHCDPAEAEFEVERCDKPCCPAINLGKPDVSGCGAGAAASFTAALNWGECPQFAVAQYRWTLDINGTRYQLFKPPQVLSPAQPQGSTTQATTTEGWENLATGSVGPIKFQPLDSGSIAVRAVIPGLPDCEVVDPRPFGIKSCCPSFVGGIVATQDPGSPCTWSFAVTVDNPLAMSLTVVWTFPDGTSDNMNLLSLPHVFPANSLTEGDVKVVVSSPKCPDIERSTTISADCRPPPQPPMDGGCWFLLIAALLLLIAGTVLFTLNACFNIGGVGTLIASGICYGAGLIALGLWVGVCGKNHCDIVSAVAIALLSLTAIAALLTLGAGLAKKFIADPSAIKAIDCLFVNGVANASVLGIATALVHWLGGLVGCVLYKK